MAGVADEGAFFGERSRGGGELVSALCFGGGDGGRGKTFGYERGDERRE